VQRNFLYTQESLEIQDAGFPGQEGVGKGSKAERKHTADVCESSGLCTSAFSRGPWEKRCRGREKKQHSLRKGNVNPNQISKSPLDSVISHPREITRYKAQKGKLRVVMPTQNRQNFWGKVFTVVRCSVQEGRAWKSLQALRLTYHATNRNNREIIIASIPWNPATYINRFQAGD